MAELIVDGFTIGEKYQELLYTELKGQGIKNKKELENYLQDYWYTKDMALKSHLLLSRSPKKQNFALPFDEE